jgi:pyridinium-3,5-bisthiocarboxylic acid mononucleotide nickel chelatase
MIAYLDMPSGISGDIFLGCLVDAGWPIEELRSVIGGLGLPAGLWSVAQVEVMRGPLRATLVEVETSEGDQHRHLHHIREIIQDADLPAQVQARAIAVFTRLAQAEAAVHGATIEDVHFHEVGALDAIIDIVGVCAGLDALGIERLYAGGLPLGEGWTQSAHGRIPLPAPATLAILAAAQAPNRPAPGPGELVTPTGAALVAELAEFRQPPMHIHKIGLGAGRKEFEWPNAARLWLGEAQSAAHEPPTATLVQLETNIDDMNPEWYAPVSKRLFGLGALDVWMTPIHMKKGRPGVLLGVLAPAEHETPLVQALLRETTTLGVRVHRVHRHEAKRTLRAVSTAYGEVRVKLKWVEEEFAGVKPEYEDCLTLAETAGVPVRVVYEAALAAFGKNEG